MDCSSLTKITFQGSAPDVGSRTFSDVADGAIATVTAANLSSFGSDGESWNGLILRTCIQVVADLEAQLADALAQRDAAITERDARPTADQLAAVVAERDARPTADQLAAVEAERDARPTLAEVQDARVGSIVVEKDWQSGEVSLCFGLQKTEDFVTWEAFEGGTWSEAPNSEFKLTLPLGEAKKWLRLTMPE